MSQERQVQIANRPLLKQTKMVLESDQGRSVVAAVPLESGWDALVYVPNDPSITGGTQARVIRIRPFNKDPGKRI